MKKSVIFIIVMACTLFTCTFSQSENRALRKGSSLYSQEQYKESLTFFEEAVKINPSNPVAQYNFGNSLFRNGKFDESVKAFDHSIVNTNLPSEKERAFYNKGVSLTRQKKLAESIVAYKSALRLDPTDEDARHNLQKALRELKKQTKSDGNKQDDPQDKPQDKPKEKPKERSKLNQRQVENYLQALRQKEQEVQKKAQQNKNRSSSQQEKDW